MKKPIVVFVLISLFFYNCNENKTKDPLEMSPGPFAHTVFFWLKNPENTSDRKAFETSLKKFINQSPFIKTKHIGVPAATNRDVIDNTYTYSLLLTFKDKATQDSYQEEPAHKQFIKEAEALWHKVIVYDSETILN